MSGGAAYVNPEVIPWDALCAVLVDSVYGGRIDNDFDSKLLTYVFVPVSIQYLYSCLCML